MRNGAEDFCNEEHIYPYQLTYRLYAHGPLHFKGLFFRGGDLFSGGGRLILGVKDKLRYSWAYFRGGLYRGTYFRGIITVFRDNYGITAIL